MFVPKKSVSRNVLQYKRLLISAFLRQLSDLKSAGFYFGARMSKQDSGVGIYKISLVAYPKNRVLYVGQSKQIKHRFHEHRWLLKNNRHTNLHLQNIYNKHGSRCFKFEIIRNCYICDLDELEQFYLNELNPECNVVMDVRNSHDKIRVPERLIPLSDIPGLEVDWKPKDWHKWVYGSGRK